MILASMNGRITCSGRCYIAAPCVHRGAQFRLLGDRKGGIALQVADTRLIGCPAIPIVSRSWMRYRIATSVPSILVASHNDHGSLFKLASGAQPGKPVGRSWTSRTYQRRCPFGHWPLESVCCRTVANGVARSSRHPFNTAVYSQNYNSPKAVHKRHRIPVLNSVRRRFAVASQLDLLTRRGLSRVDSANHISSKIFYNGRVCPVAIASSKQLVFILDVEGALSASGGIE